MAITNVIDGVAPAVDLAGATEFSISSTALVTADNFEIGQNAIVYRLGPSGGFTPATNKYGTIVLSAFPNTVVLEGPGTYKITKDLTPVAAYVGYEE